MSKNIYMYNLLLLKHFLILYNYSNQMERKMTRLLSNDFDYIILFGDLNDDMKRNLIFYLIFIFFNYHKCVNICNILSFIKKKVIILYTIKIVITFFLFLLKKLIEN
ncbi:hypothetical protein PUN28_020131 [Cardiocondyla obscurior]|uniref:Uncharacterized protein n=1 Tax=Cardiocondyla obscurior TaxID=286306 RepID=A0AAW2E9F3_9HYME